MLRIDSHCHADNPKDFKDPEPENFARDMNVSNDCRGKGVKIN